MLDLGRADLAVKIAQTGLDVWRKSVAISYDCMEHFSPQPPYGAGWGQFSSLSSPALGWFAALYTPGRMTAGFDAWIRRSTYQENTNTLRAIVSLGGHGYVEPVAISNPNSINVAAYAVGDAQNLYVTIINRTHTTTNDSADAAVTITPDGFAAASCALMALTDGDPGNASSYNVTLGGATIAPGGLEPGRLWRREKMAAAR
jgi:hypothetical protein